MTEKKTTDDLDRDIRRNTSANWLNLLIGCAALAIAIAGYLFNHWAIKACLHD